MLIIFFFNGDDLSRNRESVFLFEWDRDSRYLDWHYVDHPYIYFLIFILELEVEIPGF
jgi:hypothetical protein